MVYMGGSNREVLVLADGVWKHFGEKSRLHHVLLGTGFDLVVHQLLKQLNSEIALWHLLDLAQKFVRQDRDIRLFQSRSSKNVHHFCRGNRVGNDLSDGVL